MGTVPSNPRHGEYEYPISVNQPAQKLESCFLLYVSQGRNAPTITIYNSSIVDSTGSVSVGFLYCNLVIRCISSNSYLISHIIKIEKSRRTLFFFAFSFSSFHIPYPYPVPIFHNVQHPTCAHSS